MWIKWIKLQNIRCFDDVLINFYKKDGSPETFTVLLGENGSGKSTILRAIAMIVAGPDSLPFLVPDGRQWIRSNAQEASIEAEICPSSDDPGLETGIILELHFSSKDRSVKWQAKRGTGAFPYEGWLAAGYGPFRIPPSLAERREMYETWESEPRTARVANLFQARSKLVSVDSWLKELEYRLLKNGSPSINMFVKAIQDLLPPEFPIEYASINKEGLALFKTPNGLLTLDNLSDGYRSMMVWISDLLKNMMEAFPYSENLLHCSGLVIALSVKDFRQLVDVPLFQIIG
jgi:energy-coupling factor transporter ATP-binding protein EcfA2